MADNKHMIHSLGSSMSFGMLSLRAKVLWPMIISECDDQGRFDARPQIVKWRTCQNVNEIERDDIPELLAEMIAERMLVLYGDDNRYGQVVNWWDHQPMAYARPSKYPPPEGWTDRVRYRKGSTDWIKRNWDDQGGFAEGIPIRYRNDTPNHSDNVNEGKVQEGKPPAKAGKRDTRLDHPAIIGYKQLARLHVEIALRDDWIACAEEVGTEHLVAIVKEWIGRGYKKTNVDGMMEVAREGWKDAKASQSRKDDKYTDLDATAARRQAARDAALDA